VNQAPVRKKSIAATDLGMDLDIYELESLKLNYAICPKSIHYKTHECFVDFFQHTLILSLH